MVLQHGPLLFTLRIEDPTIAKLQFYFPWYGHWDDFQDPKIFVVTTLSPRVKTALRATSRTSQGP